MTAFDMIIDGWTAWLDGIANAGPTLPAALFLTGLALAATGRYFWKTLRFVEDVEADDTVGHSTDLLDIFPFPASITDKNGTTSTNLPDSSTALDQLPADTPQQMEFNGQESWFRICESTRESTVGRFALPIDQQIAAETRFKRLMETLTTTFAHLPVGLAVFDADRSLNMFNPALTEMLGLSPSWLAKRPDLSAFLEKLRENRHLPEKRNFLEWRRLLTEMEAAADNKDYVGEWALANGQILRVQGQAHNRGAIAFLFEDITAEVQISRLRHSEMALNQSILDHVTDAIVVLDAAGNTGFTNTRFDASRSINPDTPRPFTLNDLRNYLPDTEETDRFIKRLSAFVTASDNRTEWSRILPGPTPMIVRVFPLPDGATLISFPPVPMADATEFSAFSHLAETMFTIFNESNSMSDPLNLAGLDSFLEKRNISLNTDGFSTADALRSAPVKTRRILWYLVLAASNVCRDGGTVSLTSHENPRSTRIACLIEDDDILSGQNNHLSLGLLRQLVEQAGGGADWVFDENARPLTVSCVLPVETGNMNVASNG